MKTPPVRSYINTFRVIPELSGTKKIDYNLLAEANHKAKTGVPLSQNEDSVRLDEAFEGLARGFKQITESGRDLSSHSKKLIKKQNLQPSTESDVLKEARLKRLLGKAKNHEEIQALNKYHKDLDIIV